MNYAYANPLSRPRVFASCTLLANCVGSAMLHSQSYATRHRMPQARSTSTMLGYGTMTHLDKLSLLPALPAQVPEDAALILQELPRCSKLDDFAMIKHEDSVTLVSSDRLVTPSIRLGRSRGIATRENDDGEEFWSEVEDGTRVEARNSAPHSLVQPTNRHEPMSNDEHLRVLETRAQDMLDGLIGRVVEIRRRLVHDQEGGRAELEQAPCEGEKLSLALTWSEESVVVATYEPSGENKFMTH